MTYPLFQPLKMEHKAMFDKAFKDNLSEISEFTFTNLYSWRHAYGFEISLFGSFIILRAASKGSYKYFNPIGIGDIKAVISRILTETKSAFVRVPESTKVLFEGDAGFNIELDQANSDYLFKTLDLVSLPGRKYDGKRNLIKKFKAENKYDFIELDASNIHRCLDFEESWCSIKDCDSIEGLNNEKSAIKVMVENFSEFNLIAGAIEINKVIYALAIAERLNLNTVVMHVLKASPNIPGLYQAMMNEFLKYKCSYFGYVNLEQDLGVEGLRKSKKSYHPFRMINKYTISLK